jgi:hypothetical protein
LPASSSNPGLARGRVELDAMWVAVKLVESQFAEAGFVLR